MSRHTVARSKPSTPSPSPGPLARWNRRGTVLYLALALWLGLVLVYASSAWAMVIYRLIFDGGVLLLWLLSAVGMGSVVLPVFGASDRTSDPTLLRFATAGALGLGIFGLLVLGMGLAGVLNPFTAFGLLAAGGVAGIVRLIVLRWRGTSLRSWMKQPAGVRWLLLLAAPFAAIATVGAMLPPYMLWSPQEPHGYDVVEYHLQVPREWYEAGKIIPLHHNVFSYFPFNVEMHYLLAMHLRGGPWAGMYLAQFMHGAFLVLTILAACGFAISFAAESRKRSAPVLAALALIATPWIAQLGAIAYDEGGFLLFGTLAIGWAARAVRDPDRRLGRFALAGVLAGLACGAKLTAVPEVLLAVGVVSLGLLLMPRTRGPEPVLRRVAGPVIFGLAGLLCFAPWLVRTAVWSHGNPVFPELPSLLGHGDFSPVQVERWHRAHSPQPAQRPFGARLHALGTDVLWGWQFGYLLVPTVVVALVLERKNVEVRFLGAILFLLAVFWLGFTHLQGRFFVLAVPVCAMLIARLPRQVWPVLMVQAAVGLFLLDRAFRSHVFPEVVGRENLSWMTPEVASKVPENARLVLIGDARAFLYQRPMRLLSYRTIFDADTSHGQGVIGAWAGPGRANEKQWLLIDPQELKRFERTYQPFAPLPPGIADRDGPFIEVR